MEESAIKTNEHTQSNMAGVKWKSIEDNKRYSSIPFIYIENTQMQK